MDFSIEKLEQGLKAIWCLEVNDTRQEKLALLKYTYEQVLATQAEQIESKSNNTENIPEFGKILIKDGIKNNEIEFKLNVG